MTVGYISKLFFCRGPSGIIASMKSKLAEMSRKDLLEAARRMSPERRLQAFAEHCRLISAIARAGAENRRGAASRS